MSLLYAAGQYANLLQRALSVTCSPAVDSNFPLNNLSDGRPARAMMYGTLAANPSITFDLAAFTPSGSGTYLVTARAGERRRLNSSGTTSITLQNLSTGKYLTTGSAWQTGSTSCLTSAGSRDYQVESMTLCQVPVVVLKIVVTSGTTVGDWPRWNALVVFGHNLDVGLTCEMRSSTDNFGGSNALEVTGVILQPGFFMLDSVGVSDRYGRLLITGTNQSIPWYGELVPCWLETAVDAADVGLGLKYAEAQVRNTGPWGTTFVYPLSPWPPRVVQMRFDQLATTGAIETRQEMVLRGRGGAWPMVVVPVHTEGAMYYGRLSDKWEETRFISTRYRNDLILAEDSIAMPLV